MAEEVPAKEWARRAAPRGRVSKRRGGASVAARRAGQSAAGLARRRAPLRPPQELVEFWCDLLAHLLVEGLDAVGLARVGAAGLVLLHRRNHADHLRLVLGEGSLRRGERKGFERLDDLEPVSPRRRDVALREEGDCAEPHGEGGAAAAEEEECGAVAHVLWIRGARRVRYGGVPRDGRIPFHPLPPHMSTTLTILYPARDLLALRVEKKFGLCRRRGRM